MTIIVAEAGINHDGRLETALRLVDIARAGAADAVKFQIFNAETCKGPYREILRPLQLSLAEFTKIKAHCDDVGIRFMASCFDCAAVDFVRDLGLDTVKIGSGEITNFKLIEYVAMSGLNMILSTGMSTLDDVAKAIERFEGGGGDDFTLLHCVSNYPTKIRHCNLRAITTLKEEFGCQVGFSDHTAGLSAAVPATAIGACLIEKHFTYDRKAQGPDHRMSLAPEELAYYVRAVRLTEEMLGAGEKILQPGEEEMQKIARGRWS